MIYIKATANGEPGTLPLAKTFQYADKDDELILHHSVEMVREKILKSMKLNVNEALLLYAHFIASQMRAKKPAGAIEKDARALLSAGQVMIGVPETLRTIAFDAVVDGRRDWMLLKEPIPTSGHIMAIK